MRRPTKAFVVEVRRSARKTYGPAVAPAWDIAAALKTSAAEHGPISSQAIASTIFQNNVARPTDAPADPPWAGARILPVVAMDADSALEIERVPDPLDLPRGTVKADQRKRTPRKTRAPKNVEEPKPIHAATTPDVASTEVDQDVGDAAAFAPVARLGRVARREEPLARGERWKRRLPKVLR